MWYKQHIRQGLLIVLSGPSGAGKSSLVEALCESEPSLRFSISATTRLPRQNEIDGVNYYFLSHTEFEQLTQQGGFVEWAKYGEHYYGTLKSEVEGALSEGKDVLLEIDVQGAMEVKKQNFKTVLVFILPPSFEILANRLRGRKTESDAERQQRLETASSEVASIKNYDYYVINPENEIHQAVQQIRDIISVARCRIDNRLVELVNEEFSPPTLAGGNMS
jgi:guanylate kinase